MKILVTNDDGYQNPGIWALTRAVKELGDVTVVAPADNQSGVGTGLSYRKPVRVNEVESQISGIDCYAVDGTPGDSVVLGLKHVLSEQVDAVVAGINPGFNTSRNMFISGTFGAAITAANLGVKATAFSMDSLDDIEDGLVQKIITRTATELIDERTPQGSLFNVNFPSFTDRDIRGAAQADPAVSLIDMMLQQRGDGAFEMYSRLALKWDGSDISPGTDVAVLDDGYVSMTAVEAHTLTSIPDDPSLQRMIAAANSVIG